MILWSLAGGKDIWARKLQGLCTGCAQEHHPSLSVLGHHWVLHGILRSLLECERVAEVQPLRFGSRVVFRGKDFKISSLFSPELLLTLNDILQEGSWFLTASICFVHIWSGSALAYLRLIVFFPEGVISRQRNEMQNYFLLCFLSSLNCDSMRCQIEIKAWKYSILWQERFRLDN